MEKILYLIRGVSGAGKSTFANRLGGATVLEADVWFDRANGGVFNPKLLPRAHQWCFTMAEGLMLVDHPKIAVANTFTTIKELNPYLELAEKHGYKVFSIIVENRNGTLNVHDVPEEVLTKQEARFNVKLR